MRDNDIISGTVFTHQYSFNKRASPHHGELSVSRGVANFPLDNSPRILALFCSVRVRVMSGVSRVRVRVGSVGLGLGLVGLVLGLGLELGLGLWFGLGEISRGKCPTLHTII